MRLIDTDKLTLHDFSSQEKPAYAILSHRWTDSEVLFADICSNNHKAKLESLKIEGTAKLAKEHGLDYFWIDTCCIDKQSSAELSEAINSMYSWYRNAGVCYVYLHDVDINDGAESFRRSEWFDRGWTLQELLAPEDVLFYDRGWQFLGTKSGMAVEISEITSIHMNALGEGFASLETYSVAQKLSWAAKRTTTRLEDRAYCLMGLFDVNMPLLYGEGEKAFLRLQEEIIKDTDDRSIFAWSMGDSKGSGLLAPSPNCFAACRDVEFRPNIEGQDPFWITNRGLSITLRLIPWTLDTYLAALGCFIPSANPFEDSEVGIFLRRLTEDDQYIRIKLGLQDTLPLNCLPSDRITSTERKLYVRKKPDLVRQEAHLKDRVYGFEIFDWQSMYFRIRVDCKQSTFTQITIPYVRDGEQSEHTLSYLVVSKIVRPSTEHSESIPIGRTGQVAVIDIFKKGKGLIHVSVGFDEGFNPFCCVEASWTQFGRMGALHHRGFSWSYDFCDTTEWTETYPGSQVYLKNQMTGIWALKGHRINGLSFIDERLRLNEVKVFWRSAMRHLERQQLVWKVAVMSLVLGFESLLFQDKDIGFEIGIKELTDAVVRSQFRSQLYTSD